MIGWYTSYSTAEEKRPSFGISALKINKDSFWSILYCSFNIVSHGPNFIIEWFFVGTLLFWIFVEVNWYAI